NDPGPPCAGVRGRRPDRASDGEEPANEAAAAAEVGPRVGPRVGRAGDVTCSECKGPFRDAFLRLPGRRRKTPKGDSEYWPICEKCRPKVWARYVKHRGWTEWPARAGEKMA